MTWKKFAAFACASIFISAVFTINIVAGGPPLKENVCSSCHADVAKIFPKTHPDMGKGEPCLSCHAPDPSNKEATKFSTSMHTIHKQKQECSACHAL